MGVPLDSFLSAGTNETQAYTCFPLFYVCVCVHVYSVSVGSKHKLLMNFACHERFFATLLFCTNTMAPASCVFDGSMFYTSTRI